VIDGCVGPRRSGIDAAHVARSSAVVHALKNMRITFAGEPMHLIFTTTGNVFHTLHNLSSGFAARFSCKGRLCRARIANAGELRP
jgi:hypothetical protein